MSNAKQSAWVSDHTPEMFQALGEFVFMCSTVEISVHAVLKRLLRIEDELVRVLVKEARMNDLLDYLAQAARFRKLHPDQLAALDLLRQEISYLNNVRSFVAHKPAIQRADGSLLFHNTMTAPKLASVYAYVCTTTALRAAAEYGKRVLMHLLDLDIKGKADPKTYLQQVRELRSWREKLQLPTDPKDKKQQSSAPTLQLRPSWPKSAGGRPK